MTRLPNYVCVTCGRSFTTARSGRRHVAIVELGKGYITTDADYRTLLLTGRIPPPIPRIISKKPAESSEPNFDRLAQEEFTRGFYRRMGQQVFDDYAKTEQMSALKKIFFMRTSSNVFKT